MRSSSLVAAPTSDRRAGLRPERRRERGAARLRRAAGRPEDRALLRSRRESWRRLRQFTSAARPSRRPARRRLRVCGRATPGRRAARRRLRRGAARPCTVPAPEPVPEPASHARVSETSPRRFGASVPPLCAPRSRGADTDRERRRRGRDAQRDEQRQRCRRRPSAPPPAAPPPAAVAATKPPAQKALHDDDDDRHAEPTAPARSPARR